MNTIYTVVLIDDDILVLQALRDQLKPAFQNISFETCQSGEEALELVEQIMADGGTLAAVVSDHLMDGMSGAELLVRLQLLVPKARKIMLTGQAGLEDVSRAVNSGALYRYIAKPWNADDMRMTLHEALVAYWNEADLEARNTEVNLMNSQLESLVIERTQELLAKNRELEEGIEYAGHVQQTLFPEFKQLGKSTVVSEIFLRPFNQVSGDFYWMSDADRGGKVFVAVGDCTGHGISGGFMSVMHIAALNEAMFQLNEPSPLGLLTYMNARIEDLTKHTFRMHRALIGVESTMLCFDPDGQTVHFASDTKGLLVRDMCTGEISDPIASGKHSIDPETGKRDIAYGSFCVSGHSEIFVFTDGVVDQFGGPTGKKLKRSGLKKWIAERGQPNSSSETFGEYFQRFSEDKMIVDDALMLVFSSHEPQEPTILNNVEHASSA
jgi:sigma-B regulation protein RsbU (phosphoserine phosphatase)